MRTLTLLFLSACGSQDYALTQVPDASPAQVYQAKVLDFLCLESSYYVDTPDCWNTLAEYWAWCVEEHDNLDEDEALNCIELMNAGGVVSTENGRATIPADCMVSRLVVPQREDGQSCVTPLQPIDDPNS